MEHYIAASSARKGGFQLFKALEEPVVGDLMARLPPELFYWVKIWRIWRHVKEYHLGSDICVFLVFLVPDQAFRLFMPRSIIKNHIYLVAALTFITL